MKILKLVLKKSSQVFLVMLFLALLTLGTPLGAAAEVKGPRIGGTMVIGYSGSDVGVIIGFWANSEMRNVGSEVYNGLIEYDAEYNKGPELATSWESSADNLHTTFHLRDDVYWHDGEKFTSADVKFTFEGIGQLVGEAQTSYKLGVDLESVDAPDDYTAVFNWMYPHPLTHEAFDNLGVFACPVAPAHLYVEGNAEDWVSSRYNIYAVGTGPFKLKEWVFGSHIELVRNENYWRKDENGIQLPYLDRIIYRFIPDQSTMLAALEAGEIDFMPAGYPLARAKEMNTDVFNMTASPTAMGYTARIMFNLGDTGVKGPTANVKVRQAISMAIDRQVLVDKLLGHENGAPAVSLWAGDSLKKYRSPNNEGYAYDPAGAEKLLDEAGYKRGSDGVRLRLDRYLVSSASPIYGFDQASLIKDMLAKIGIVVTIVVVDTATVESRVWVDRPRNFDMASYTSRAGPTPQYSKKRYDSRFLQPANRENFGYINPEMDKLWDTAAMAQNDAVAIKAYQQIDELLMRDIPEMYTMAYWRLQPMRRTFHGYTFYRVVPEAGPSDRIWWEGGHLPGEAATTTATTAPPATTAVTTAQPTTPAPQIGWELPAVIAVLVVLAAIYLIYRRSRKK